MASINLYGVSGVLASGIDSASTLLEVDTSLLAAISSALGVGDVTYFAIHSGNAYELVKVTSVYAQYLVVERGQGTYSRPFPAGARLSFETTAQGILDNIGDISTAVVISGTGQAEVTNPALNEWVVGVATPAITAESGIEVLGTWPTIRLALTPKDCCGGTAEESATGITSIEGQGLIQAYSSGSEAFVMLEAPNFVGAGVTITGSWPNFTFTVASAAGGTVTSVSAGAGVTVTGAPTVNPTVSIANTGVTPGTYGGVVINARGQLTAVPATLNPVSVVNVSAPVTVSRTADAVTLGVSAAAIGVAGVAAFSDHTDPFNPADDATAATPALVAAALATLTFPSVSGADSFTAEPDASYTNTVSATATTLSLTTGQKAIVYAHMNMQDALLSTAVDYGLAVFSAVPVKLKGDKITRQQKQSILFVIEGPFSSTITLATTAIPSGASMISYGLQVLKL